VVRGVVWIDLSLPVPPSPLLILLKVFHAKELGPDLIGSRGQISRWIDLFAGLSSLLSIEKLRGNYATCKSFLWKSLGDLGLDRFWQGGFFEVLAGSFVF
jgi:hypothetical protein